MTLPAVAPLTAALLAELLVALAGCAAASREPMSTMSPMMMLPSMAQPSVAGGALNGGAQRMILVTIANPSALVLSEPGSTPHGYDAIESYSVSDQARATGAALGRDYDLQQVRAWPIAPLGVQCLVFALPPDADRDALLRRLAADRRVRLAQPLQVFDALAGSRASGAASGGDTSGGNGDAAVSAYNDPYIGLQQGFAAIQAGAAQQWSRGEHVRVAIIDTGADLSHPDLAGRIAQSRNFIDDDMSAFATDRHGTSIAGIIGADANNHVGIVGVAPLVQLQVYKACQPLQPHGLTAQCNSFTLALALDAAISAHAQIVNLSLGGPADPLLAQLVSYGQRRGMIFVGAVPEDGRLDGFPLGIPGVIAVDQVGRSPAAAGVLHAPGRDILSLAPAGGYDFATGSSFAAAHVTGAIALLRARWSTPDAAALAAVLERTRTHAQEGDRINIFAAMTALQPRNCCTQAATALATASATH